MVRIQIQLTEDQTTCLRELAHAGNEFLAAVIRKALDQYLSRQEPDRCTFTGRHSGWWASTGSGFTTWLWNTTAILRRSSDHDRFR